MSGVPPVLLATVVVRLFATSESDTLSVSTVAATPLPLCSVQPLGADEVPSTPLKAPVIARQEVSTTYARIRGWDRQALQRDFGAMQCAVNSRYVWDLLKPQPNCADFIAAMPQPGLPTKEPPPLTLSFHQGADEHASESRRLLERDIMMPDWVSHVLNSDANVTLSLSYGANGSGSKFHENHPRTAMALLTGRKHWLLMPPGAMRQLRARSEDGLYALAGPGVVFPGRAWHQGLWKQLLSKVRGAVACMQEPGTVLAVPDYWGHATINEGDTLGVGMQVTDQAPARWNDHPDENSRAAALKAVERGGISGKRGQTKEQLVAAIQAMLRESPLETLRELFQVQALWRHVEREDAGSWDNASTDLYKAVDFVAAWLQSAVGDGRISPEHCISAAVIIFPFGFKLPSRPKLRAVAIQVWGVARLAFEMTFASADPAVRGDAAVLLAAMAADLGEPVVAVDLLAQHVAHGAQQGDHVAVSTGATDGTAWQRCVVTTVRLQSIGVRCAQAALPSAGESAFTWAPCDIFSGLPYNGGRGTERIGNVSLGQHVLIEERQGDHVRLVSPLKGWAPLRDSLGQPLIASKGRKQQVARSSKRIGWRLGANMSRNSAQLAMRLSRRLVQMCSSLWADPTLAASMRVGGDFATERNSDSSSADLSRQRRRRRHKKRLDGEL